MNTKDRSTCTPRNARRVALETALKRLGQHPGERCDFESNQFMSFNVKRKIRREYEEIIRQLARRLAKLEQEDYETFLKNIGSGVKNSNA